MLGKLTSTVLRGGESREAQTLPDSSGRELLDSISDQNLLSKGFSFLTQIRLTRKQSEDVRFL